MVGLSLQQIGHQGEYDKTKQMLAVETDAEKPGMLILKSLANGPLVCREEGNDDLRFGVVDL